MRCSRQSIPCRKGVGLVEPPTGGPGGGVGKKLGAGGPEGGIGGPAGDGTGGPQWEGGPVGGTEGPVGTGGGPRRGPPGGGTDPETGARFTGFPRKVGTLGILGIPLGLVPCGVAGT